MNTIKQLIEKYCPEGVEYKKLGEISNINRGVRVVRSDLQQEGEIPVYQNSLLPLGYYNKSNCPKDSVFVISAGAAGDIGYSNIPFWAADDCLFLDDLQGLQQKFIYYYLCSKSKLIKSQVRRASVPRLSRKVIENMIIPVPPLSVQREIVRILDNFTSLEAELEAELEARRKQYEYYRDQLLSFKHLTGGGRSEVEWKTLGEIGDVCMCKRIMKHQTNEEGGIPFYKIGTFGKTADAFISEELYEEYKQKYSFPRKGEVLISAAGTIGRAVIYNGMPAYFQDSNIVWIANDETVVLNKYLYYFYSVADWRLEGGTIKRLYNNNLKAVKIPVPPLSTQHRIVSILDRFESLVNDITTGLPAEIAARHQQYEYYRDQLLTFKRKS